jgi:hypothetical protein
MDGFLYGRRFSATALSSLVWLRGSLQESGGGIGEQRRRYMAGATPKLEGNEEGEGSGGGVERSCPQAVLTLTRAVEYQSSSKWVKWESQERLYVLH